MAKKKILVVGGAGYIGSHMVKFLRHRNFDVVVLDNLVTGHREAVRNAELVEGDIGDTRLLDRLFTQHRFDAVMHFASYIQVGESVKEPAKYYDNNVTRTLSLMDAMVRYKVDTFLFSSTAAVFGNPEYQPIDEKHPKHPINPYGKTKLMIEQALEDYRLAYGLRYGALRYFNAAGADPEGELGECHEPETHLIPLILQAASGKRPFITMFGNDYDTRDGTCVRDYIHIMDLCDAHLKTLEYLWGGNTHAVFNLGTGDGFTVAEVIEAAKRITGKNFTVRLEGRREGDPASLVADGSAAQKTLGWKPQRSSLEAILHDAWQWEQKRIGTSGQGKAAVS